MVAKRGISDRIVAEIAEREGSRPVELDEPLYDAVDPDALDALVPSERDHLRISFAYLGYVITVSADGRIEVSEPDESE